MSHFGMPPTPDESRDIQRVRLAQEFGWTLPEIDRLLAEDPFSVAAIWGVIDGQNRVAEHERGKAKRR